MDNPLIAWCPSCAVQLGPGASYAQAVSNAQVHSTVTGHPTNVLDDVAREVVECLSGEPSLPLWD